jgi:hypothetical protein
VTHEQELIEAYLQGLRHENERIIALLENEACECENYGEDYLPYMCVPHRVIALIKGEQPSIIQDKAATYIKGDALTELRDLSHQTGEYDNFDNPLIEGEQS